MYTVSIVDMSNIIVSSPYIYTVYDRELAPVVKNIHDIILLELVVIAKEHLT